MPRKELITKGMVLAAGTSLVRAGGLGKLTARNIARELGCSTIPIYSHFRSMGELETEVLLAGSSLLLEYTKKQYTPHPFLNMGVGMILFSRDESELFRAIFSGEGKAGEVIDGIRTAFRDGLIVAEGFDQFSPEMMDELLDMMMTYTLGLAAMASSGLLDDPSEGNITRMLDEAGDAMINHTIRKALCLDTSAGAVFREHKMSRSVKKG